MSENFPELQNKDLRDDSTYMHAVIEGMIGKGEKWGDSLARAVMNLHDGIQRENEKGEAISDTKEPPKVIFVTATSAIPYATAIKECWKAAYPDENQPKFFFVDVSKKKLEFDQDLQYILKDEEVERIDFAQIEKLKHIGDKYDAFNNTVVFDEYTHTGRTLEETQRQLEQAGFRNVNFMYGNWGHQHPDQGIPEEIRPLVRKRKEGSPYRPLVIQVNEDSKNLVKDMKMIGRQMGNEIFRHKQTLQAAEDTSNTAQKEKAPDKLSKLRRVLKALSTAR